MNCSLQFFDYFPYFQVMPFDEFALSLQKLSFLVEVEPALVHYFRPPAAALALLHSIQGVYFVELGVEVLFELNVVFFFLLEVLLLLVESFLHLGVHLLLVGESDFELEDPVLFLYVGLHLLFFPFPLLLISLQFVLQSFYSGLQLHIFLTQSTYCERYFWFCLASLLLKSLSFSRSFYPSNSLFSCLLRK